MDAPVQILCRQCSAPLAIETGTQFVTCEFCGTTNVVDKGQTVLHYAVRPTVRENDAEAALRRWMAGNDTIKGLDQKAQISQSLFQYFPMWLVRVSRESQEQVILEPAAALSVSELKQLTIPAADLEPYDHVLEESSVEATVPYKAMLTWLKEEHKVVPAALSEVSLVHLPIYTFKYSFKDRSYTAVVDGATGQVFANIFPSKWEVPYLAIGAAAFVAYFCIAFIPLAGYLMGDFGGMGLGVVIYAAIAAVLAVPFFVFAATVAARA